MDKIIQSLVSQYVMKNRKNTTDLSPEEKKEAQLSTTDRLHLVSADHYNIDDFDALLNIQMDKELNIDQKLFTDLEIFIDNNLSQKNTVFSKIDTTETIFGTICNKEILSSPVTDKNLLRNRQNTIKKLNNNQNINEITQLLKEIKGIEKDIIWFWKHANTPHMDVLCDLVYFKLTDILSINDRLNNNEHLLTLSNIYTIFLNPVVTLITPIMTVIFPIVMLAFVQKRLGNKVSIGSLFKLVVKNIFNFNQFIPLVKNKMKARMIAIMSTSIWMFFYVQNIMNTIKLSKNTKNVIHLMQNKIQSICKFVVNSEKITKFIDNDNKQLCNLYSLDIDVDKMVKNFVYLLKHDVFIHNEKLFNNKGKILKSFKIVNTIKGELRGIMKYIGIVDSLVSYSNLINHSNFTFPEYQSGEKPLLICNGSWHPYLENPVKNNFDITNANNLLITGPNAAGKSTFIKSIACNILFSQTIGIVAAEEFIISPFKVIETYLHIPDQNGTSSLFETEMLRSKRYIERVKSLKKEEFSFIIMDEIFSSTNYVEGAAGAYAILKKLSKFHNNVTFITTHYSVLSELENSTNQKFKNYKFEIYRNNDNLINYNYKLKRGISNQNIALELLKENNFDEEIIEDAIKFSKKINTNIKKKKNTKIKNNCITPKKYKGKKIKILSNG